MRTLTLLVKGVDLRWETADKTKLLALIKCERSAFIPVRIGENSIASKGDTKGPAGGGGGGHDRSNIKTCCLLIISTPVPRTLPEGFG